MIHVDTVNYEDRWWVGAGLYSSKIIRGSKYLVIAFQYKQSLWLHFFHLLYVILHKLRGCFRSMYVTSISAFITEATVSIGLKNILYINPLCSFTLHSTKLFKATLSVLNVGWKWHTLHVLCYSLITIQIFFLNHIPLISSWLPNPNILANLSRKLPRFLNLLVPSRLMRILHNYTFTA